MGQGFKKEQRVRREAEFQILYRKGTLAKGKSMTLRLWTDDGAAEGQKAKLAITVSRKVSKLAPQRNLWRRRIREIFRTQQQLIKSRTWIWVRVISDQRAPSYRVLCEEMCQLLGQLKGIVEA
ncbi:MAG: ribonuclease P protein component [Candidatus Omnitrophica bacterium]|nr:ribonuclease P protein component [Candidatus Omnitrophota bacterium]